MDKRGVVVYLMPAAHVGDVTKVEGTFEDSTISGVSIKTKIGYYIFVPYTSIAFIRIDPDEDD
jgi:hypothetical protein